MRKNWLLLVCSFCFLNATFGNNTLNIPGITLHLDANSGVEVNSNNELVTWTPITGNAIFRPIDVAPILQNPALINGYSAVKFSFDGNDILTDSTISIGSIVAFTHFINPNNDNIFPGSSGLISSKNIDLFFMGQEGSNDMFYNNQFSQFTEYIINKEETTKWGNMSDWKVIIGRGNEESISHLIIGTDRGVNTREWNGYVTEIIAFDHFITDTEVDQINDYFYNKYQVSLDIVDEIVKNDFCEDTVHLNNQFQSVSWLNLEGDTLSTDSLFVVDKSESIIVAAKDIFGEVHSDTIHVIYPELASPPTTTFCAGESYVWDTQLGSNFNYTWIKNYNDTISQLEIFNFSLENLDSIHVIVEDKINACVFVSDTIVVQLDTLTEIEFSLDYDTVCSGQSVGLLPPIENINLLWEGLEQTDRYTVWETDSLNVVVSNTNGCSQEITTGVVVNGISPVANFSFDYLCEPQTIKLFDQSYFINESGDSLNATNFVTKNWVIDNETLAIGDSLVVNELQEGNHLFKYIIEGNGNCIDSVTKTVQINAVKNPILTYEGECVGDTVKLVDTQNYSPFIVTNRIWNVNNIVYQDDSLIKVLDMDSAYRYEYNVKFENGCSNSEVGEFFLEPEILCKGVSEMQGVTLHLDAGKSVVLADDNKLESWTSLVSPITFEPMNEAPSVASPFEINGSKALEFTSEGNALTTSSPISIGSIVAITKFNNSNQTNQFPGNNGLVSSKNIDLFFLGQEGTNNLFFNNQFSKYSYYNINREQKSSWGDMEEWKIIIGSGDAEIINDLIIGQDRTVQNREWNGYLAELIAFDHQLSEGEIDTIYSYLETKYHQSHYPISDITNTTLCPTRVELLNNFIRYRWFHENEIISTDSILETRLSGEFSLQVTNAFGKIYRDTFMITNPVITSDFKTSICLDSSFNWTMNTGSSFEATWYKNNQLFSSDNLLLDTQPIDGDQYFGLLTDSLNCQFTTDTLSVEIDSFALLSFLPNDTTMCGGQTISPDMNDDYSFLWGNNDTSFFREVELEGDYILRSLNSNNCLNTDTIDVNIKGAKPEVTLLTNEVLCQEDVLSAGLEAQNYGAISTIEWRVNDTLQSNDSIMSYELLLNGDYQVSLSVIDSIGCEALIDTSFVIYAKPIADFDNGLSCSLDSTSFFDRSSVVNGSITSWQWISKTDTFNIANSTIYYSEGGNDLVTLIVGSDQNCYDTTQQNIIINSNALPKINADINCVNQESILLSESVDFGNSITQWKWDVDGNILLGDEINYTFNVIGDHVVQLEVTNDKACVNDTIISVEITPVPTIIIEHDGLCADNTLSLFVNTHSTLDTIISAQWYLGDFGAFTGKSIELQLTNNEPNGIVEVITERECKMNHLLDLQLAESPIASFSVSNYFGAPPLNVEMINSSDNYSSIEWHTSEDTITDIDTLQQTYLEEGIYDVKLIARNEEGCLSEKTSSIEVFEPNFNINFNSFYIDDSNYLHLIVENSEKISITNPILQFDFGTQNTLTFQTDTSIKGGSMYEFISDFEVDQNNLPSLKYICVNVSFDQTTEQFSSCITHTTEPIIDLVISNPATDDIGINLFSPIDQEVNVSLYNTEGVIVQDMIFNVSTGGNNLLINKGDFNSGMYFLKFDFNDSSIVQKIIFQ